MFKDTINVQNNTVKDLHVTADLAKQNMFTNLSTTPVDNDKLNEYQSN